MKFTDRPRGDWTRGGREWFHICFDVEGTPLLLNLLLERLNNQTVSTVSVMSLGSPALSTRHRAVCDRPFEPASFSLDRAVMRFTAAGVEVEVDHPDCRLRALLVPRGWSTAPSSTHFGDGTLNWSVSPDCDCTGLVESAGRVRRLGARAYLDHNWGDFRWGPALAWNWAYFHAEGLAGVWMTMRRRDSREKLGAALLLWEQGRSSRSWVAAQLSAHEVGSFSEEALVTLPHALGQMLPDRLVGVPQSFEVSACSPTASLTITPVAGGRLVVPDDTGLGASVINELSCRTRFAYDGRTFEGTGVLEVLRAA